MKTKHIFLNAILVLTFLCGAKAQTASCDLLSITAINPDTINPGDYQVSIQFNGSVDEFIGYPLITSVLNCNGDTAAAGTLSWFGQLGQTQQEYPISVTGDISCGPLTVNFQYLDDQGNEVVCLLNFNPVPVGACDLLSLVSFNPDSLEANVYQISVRYDGIENEFIGGPIINTLVNCNGDIVGTGIPFWFGQAGQTTQEYPVTITGDISCGPLTAYFLYYDGVGETVICPLTINQLPTGINGQISKNQILCFPNPAEDFVTLQVDAEWIGSLFQIIDISGKLVQTGSINSGQAALNLSKITPGIYFLKLQSDAASIVKIVKL